MLKLWYIWKIYTYLVKILKKEVKTWTKWVEIKTCFTGFNHRYISTINTFNNFNFLYTNKGEKWKKKKKKNLRFIFIFLIWRYFGIAIHKYPSSLVFPKYILQGCFIAKIWVWQLTFFNNIFILDLSFFFCESLISTVRLEKYIYGKKEKKIHFDIFVHIFVITK